MHRRRDDDGDHAWLPHDAFDTLGPRIEQLHLGYGLDLAIMDRVFDTSRAALFRAVDTSDYIHKLLELYPSLSPHQRNELLAIADELIAISRQVPREALHRAQLMQQEASAQWRRQTEPADPMNDFADDWAGIKRDVARVKRWFSR